MQYLGGKTRLKKHLAPIVAEAVPDGGVWWDPFCGGLSMAAALAKETGRPGLVSDANLALIALYKAVSAGWNPPETLSESEYAAAKDLPDTDPLKAFAGFGCSFGGKWFGGYARDRKGDRNFACESRRSLLRDTKILEDSVFACLSFMDREPFYFKGAIYCDPPYAGTQGYPAVGGFDHEAFFARCEEWAALGVPVFVSEYQIERNGWAQVWDRTYASDLSSGVNGKSSKRTDRLYRVVLG